MRVPAPPPHGFFSLRLLRRGLFLFASPRAVRALPIALFAIVAPATNAADDAPASSQRELTASAATDAFPYSYRDDSGQLTGYAIDLLDAVAETMHVRLRRIPVATADGRALADLVAGRYDLGFHAPVPGRIDGAAYSQPVLINHGDIFVRRDDPGFRSLDSLRANRRRIATPQQGEDYLVQNGFDRSLIQGGTAAQCLTALSRGEVDAVILSRLTGLAQAHFLGLDNVEPVGASLPGLRVAYCIVVRQQDVELLAEINEALATLSVTGRLQEIYSRWFRRHESAGLSTRDLLLLLAGSLGLALLVALWCLHRQRTLRREIAAQAAQLAESREILDAAQHFARLGHWQRSLVPTQQIAWSAETYRIFERDPALPPYTPDEIVQLAPPAERARWREAIEASNREGQPYNLVLDIDPRPGLTKTVHINARPVFDASGRQTGVFGTVQDVTAPRAAELALRRSEQLLRALYANLPIGLGVAERCDGGWQITSANPAATQHLAAPTSADTSSPFTLRQTQLAPEWQEFWDRLLADSTAAGHPLTREFVRRDLQRVFVTTAIPLDPADRLARACFLIEDVTERRRHETEISQGRRLRAIGELVGGIAHEFNNLLTPIRLGTELLLSDCKHDPTLASQLKLIAGAAERSSQLVQRLLTFGRQSESRSELFDLHAIVASNVDLLRPAIDRRMTIATDVSPSLPRLFLPTGAVHQIVVNLLLNARDTLADKLASSPPPGWSPRIDLAATVLSPNAVDPSPSSPTRPVHAWIRLTIRDNGCGMRPEVIERLFEPFYTTKQVGSGTGLGLATVWHLATGFGGRVEAESTFGSGSAFHVILPVLGEPKPAASSPDSAAPSPSETESDRPRNLLLVDDEHAIAELVAKFLRRHGHQITAVTHADEAWTMLSSAPDAYDAIIVDLNMPGINGVEFARRARALPYLRPIVVITGRVTDADRQALAGVDVTAILGKPFTFDEFESVLREALGRRPSAQPFSR